MYEDSEYRYLHDPEFHAVVDMLQAHAMQHGWTPGELKQMAFYAALRCEMYAARHVGRCNPERSE